MSYPPKPRYRHNSPSLWSVFEYNIYVYNFIMYVCIYTIVCVRGQRRFKCTDNNRCPNHPAGRRCTHCVRACRKLVWPIVVTTTPCPKVVETSSSRYKWPYRSPRDTCTNFLLGSIFMIIIAVYFILSPFFCNKMYNIISYY